MIPVSEMLWRLAQAIALGGLIGLERERRDRPAGFRTHMLVALASATFMLVSIDFVHYQARSPEGRDVRVDPSRIASYVVAGLGFLGAGTIIRGGRGVQGITTAATLWLVTALGLAAGAGMFALAWSSSLAALFVLVVLRVLERRIERHRPVAAIRRRLCVECNDPDGTAAPAIQTAVEAAGSPATSPDLSRHPVEGRTTLTFDLRLPGEDRIGPLLTRIETIPGVVRISLGRDRKP